MFCQKCDTPQKLFFIWHDSKITARPAFLEVSSLENVIFLQIGVLWCSGSCSLRQKSLSKFLSDVAVRNLQKLLVDRPPEDLQLEESSYHI